MQKIRRGIAVTLIAIASLSAGLYPASQAIADESCNSATYSDMRSTAKDAAQADTDRIKGMFDRVRNMNVQRMACLDIFKNMSIGGTFSSMNMDALINKLVEAFWNMACDMVMDAYNDAVDGVTSSLANNLELPGEVGRFVGPVVNGQLGVVNNTDPFVRGRQGYSTQTYTKDLPSAYR